MELRRGDPCPFCQDDHLSSRPACPTLAELFESSDPGDWWVHLNHAAGAQVTVEPDPAYHGTRIRVRLVHGFDFGAAVERPWVARDHEVRVDDYALALRERPSPYQGGRREVLQIGARMLESWHGPGARGAAVAVRLLCLRGPTAEAFTPHSVEARRQLEGWRPGPLSPSWPGDFRVPASSFAGGDDFMRRMAQREEAAEAAWREAVRAEISFAGVHALEVKAEAVLPRGENHSTTVTGGRFGAWAARARAADGARRLER